MAVCVAASLLSIHVLFTSRSRSTDVYAEPPRAEISGVAEGTELRRTLPGVLTGRVLAPEVLVAPAWSGLVTDVLVDEEQALAEGPILEVDGITRVAVSSSRPFHRSLSPHFRGPDVVQLNAYLARAGYLEAELDDEEHYSWLTGAAVRRLSADLGVWPTTDVFDPAWFVWLPGQREFVVASVAVAVGSPAPVQGAELVGAHPHVVDVTFRPEGGNAAVESGEWEVTAPGLRGLLVDGDVTGVEPSEILGATPQADGAGEEGPASDGTFSVAVTAASTEPRATFVLPASSIRTSNDGTAACVFVRAGDEWQAVVVEPTAGPGSEVYLDGEPDVAGGVVLFNPGEVLEDARCPSS